MVEQLRFAFIGGGNMAEALLKGLLSGLHIPATQITATDVVPQRLAYLETTYGIATSTDNLRAVQEHEVMILAVKPQIMPEVLKAIAPAVTRDKLVISIAAGIPLQTLQQGLGVDSRVIRVMPNTPALVLSGAAGISPGKAATPHDVALVERIFTL
jgi:pyrroline-5-carboxylate reductase